MLIGSPIRAPAAVCSMRRSVRAAAREALARVSSMSNQQQGPPAQDGAGAADSGKPAPKRPRMAAARQPQGGGAAAAAAAGKAAQAAASMPAARASRSRSAAAAAALGQENAGSNAAAGQKKKQAARRAVAVTADATAAGAAAAAATTTTTRSALFELEASLRAQGFKHLVGVDEAGRGPLAGPVVAAACCIPEGVLIDGVDDSKALSERQREAAYAAIMARDDVLVAVEVVERDVIDDINILQATFAAMRGAVAALPPGRVDYVLVDGPYVPKGMTQRAQAVVKGDSRCYSIAAASIVAKVTRDRLMEAADALYPQYGFARHKGYGTAAHVAAIKAHGPCPIHRRSFAPIKGMVAAEAAAKAKADGAA